MPGNVISCGETAVPLAAEGGKLQLGYWSIRGLAEPIRLALEHVGAEYDDVRIDAGPADSDEYKQHWMKKVKPQLAEKHAFINLPYMFDGDQLIPQSNAILRHIARKYPALYGPNATATDVILDAGVDFDNAFTGMCYGRYNEMKEELHGDFGWWGGLDKFEAVARQGSGASLAGGEGPTIADFKVWETLRKIELMVPGTLQKKGLTALTKFYETMNKLPAIEAYIKSGRAIEHPCNNPHAQWK
eukprot:Hpha_TRINITY_DN10018_c0_g1::TRINITY_DN10018_c0_g1_i1::g.83933::m.83933/K00799/GST, gst; glutathione S-transferase